MTVLSVQAKPPHPQGRERGAVAVAQWRTSKGCRPLTPRAQAPLQRTRERENVSRRKADPPGDSRGGAVHCGKKPSGTVKGGLKTFSEFAAKSDKFRKRFQLQPLTEPTQTF